VPASSKVPKMLAEGRPGDHVGREMDGRGRDLRD
jgi:hypothetical protein